jgi:hypothetical protein
MNRKVPLILALISLPLTAGVLEAQGGGGMGGLRPGRRAAQQEQPGGANAMRRQQLEQQIRRGFWRAAKVRIGFSDDQMHQLEETSQRYDARRRALAQEEKAQRVALRREILADSAADQSTISASLDRLHQLQRQRLELQAEEQKDFEAFMTPLQRAKFLALQEQVRRRMQELVRARPDSAGTGPPPDAP